MEVVYQMYEFAELNEGHPLGDDSSEKLSTPSITSRRINALRRTKRSPKPCLPFQTTDKYEAAASIDRAAVFGVVI